MLKTFRDVVKSTRVMERNKEIENKSTEGQAQVKAKAKEMRKGKKSF